MLSAAEAQEKQAEQQAALMQVFNYFLTFLTNFLKLSCIADAGFLKTKIHNFLISFKMASSDADFQLFSQKIYQFLISFKIDSADFVLFVANICLLH